MLVMIPGVCQSETIDLDLAEATRFQGLMSSTLLDHVDMHIHLEVCLYSPSKPFSGNFIPLSTLGVDANGQSHVWIWPPIPWAIFAYIPIS